MHLFLWKFLYDIMLFKSPPVHHPCQHITGIFPLSYQFYFSNKDTPIEILTFFLLITCGKFHECIDKDGEHVKTI